MDLTRQSATGYGTIGRRPLVHESPLSNLTAINFGTAKMAIFCILRPTGTVQYLGGEDKGKGR
jgi:hypothetical protein